MNGRLEELYTNDGKSLFELIQEWIDENNYFLYYKCKNEQVKYFIDK